VNAEALLQRLADGNIHSGTDLAQEFAVTRAAIWKHVAKLDDWGVEVRARPGYGYQLEHAIDLLDRARLSAAVGGSLRGRVRRMDVFTEIGSTNRHLREQDKPEPGLLDVCVAEFQTAGRGRRSRVWHSPLGAGLCMSVAWTFRETPPQLSALTLAVGVAVRRVLAVLSNVEINLKWPNDLVWADRKLGGMLLEMNSEAQGGCHVVAGIGINVSIPPDSLRQFSDWPEGATDLMHATSGRPPRRTDLVIALAAGLADLFTNYAAVGFSAYREEWQAADYLKGRSIRLDDAGGTSVGTAVGIEADGALLLEIEGGTRRVISGDVSVRAQP
jgi:BirA family biotin operon repressor/biotin-[acetyl-CoA-carboxylase] ligase